MIEFCLESVECDPDAEIKSTEPLKLSNKKHKEDEDEDDGDEEEEENDDDDENENEGKKVNKQSEQNNKYIDESDDDVEETRNNTCLEDTSTDDEENENGYGEDEDSDGMDQTPSLVINKKSESKFKETSVFSLLSTVPFIESIEKHPLEIFLQKTKNPNVLHHKTNRTPLLEAIVQQQIQTSEMLINNSLCDINLSTSNLSNEQKQTPLMFACKLQLLSVIKLLLKHKNCNISLTDYLDNQAIHYYLQTSIRSNEYLEILKIFIQKLKPTGLNIQGKSKRTPLHIAVYHNLGTIDAITDIEKILIENGSDLLLKDSLGNIPLHNVFLNKNAGHDPVELCLLIIKSMNYQSLDTYNNKRETPLHLAVVSLTSCFFSLRMIEVFFLFVLRQNVVQYV